MHGRSKRSRDPETSPEADSSASGSVSLRPRSQRRVVPESLITSRRRDSAEGTSTPRDDDDEAEAEVDGSEKKQRFVWTPDLHHRFEVAVHKLGVANAKPQAIQQLMGCEEDGTIPTRQNIKSHLQKYRLRTGHRSESGRAMSSGPSGAPVNMPQALGGGMPMTQAAMDPIVQKQQTGLLEQLELQKKLDAQLLQQRNTQSALDLRMHTAGPGPTLRPAQLQRLARHVLIMRGMLQHLLTLLHAITVDFCSAGQFAQRRHATGPTPSEDEDECSSFETLCAQSGAGPIAPGQDGDVGAMSLAGAHAGLALPSALASPLPVGLAGPMGSPSTVGMGGVPQVDMTPMQSSMVDDFAGSSPFPAESASALPPLHADRSSPPPLPPNAAFLGLRAGAQAPSPRATDTAALAVTAEAVAMSGAGGERDGRPGWPAGAGVGAAPLPALPGMFGGAACAPTALGRPSAMAAAAGAMAAAMSERRGGIQRDEPKVPLPAHAEYLRHLASPSTLPPPPLAAGGGAGPKLEPQEPPWPPPQQEMQEQEQEQQLQQQLQGLQQAQQQAQQLLQQQQQTLQAAADAEGEGADRGGSAAEEAAARPGESLEVL